MFENNRNACCPGHSPCLLRKGITVIMIIFIVHANHVLYILNTFRKEETAVQRS